MASPCLSAPLPHLPFLRMWDPQAWEEPLERAAPTSARRESRGAGVQGQGVLSQRLAVLRSLGLARGSHFILPTPQPGGEGRTADKQDAGGAVGWMCPLPSLPGLSDAALGHQTNLGSPRDL